MRINSVTLAFTYVKHKNSFKSSCNMLSIRFKTVLGRKILAGKDIKPSRHAMMTGLSYIYPMNYVYSSHPFNPAANQTGT